MSQPHTSAARRGRLRPQDLLSLGVGLILVALVAFGAARLLAGAQHHAYDPGASPRATYHLTAGRTYQLSSVSGVAALKSAGLAGAAGTELQCTVSSTTGVVQQLRLDEVGDDVRSLHVFATFTSPVTGDYRIGCARPATVTDVFVDDAANAGPDYSAGLLLLSSVLGLAGVSAMLGGLYRLGLTSDARRDDRTPSWTG